jgi:hypothetical protein
MTVLSPVTTHQCERRSGKFSVRRCAHNEGAREERGTIKKTRAASDQARRRLRNVPLRKCKPKGLQESAISPQPPSGLTISLKFAVHCRFLVNRLLASPSTRCCYWHLLRPTDHNAQRPICLYLNGAAMPNVLLPGHYRPTPARNAAPTSQTG